MQDKNENNTLTYAAVNYATKAELNQEARIRAENDAKLQPKTDDSLTTNNKTIVGSINEVNAKITTGWIEGEYKWMPITVNIMPTGWKKIIAEIDNFAFTLGFGNSSGDTSSDTNWNGSDDKTKHFGIHTAYMNGYFITAVTDPETSLFKIINIIKTENLWQYDPNNLYSKIDTIEFKLPDLEQLMKK